MTCPNCEQWAELFARAAASATESGALVRQLIKRLNDETLCQQAELAERTLANVKPVNHWVN